jgi:uncharacterized protein (UPF0276 family)
VNNVFVSGFNHGFDPSVYIQSVPHDRIVQFHLAGHTHCTTHIIDTHDNHVVDAVWELYRQVCRFTNRASTLLEWDANIPEFPIVHAELLKAKTYLSSTKSADSAIVNQAAQTPPIDEVVHSSPARTVSNPISFLYRQFEEEIPVEAAP